MSWPAGAAECRSEPRSLPGYQVLAASALAAAGFGLATTTALEPEASDQVSNARGAKKMPPVGRGGKGKWWPEDAHSTLLVQGT